MISDILMPEMSGVEMAMKIAQELTHTKVLLLSGQAITLDLLKETRTKGYQFETLAKPIHRSETALTGWNLRSRIRPALG